jgi:nitrate/nitrite-specific signal transduction histidine kinase
MLIVAFGLAYFYRLTSQNPWKLSQTESTKPVWAKKTKKIVLEASSKEINLLIKSYNRMVEELEISAIKLAQSEREEARNGKTGGTWD